MISAEIRTSRGPVMVMTLTEFAKVPMQRSPQRGDSGYGDGGAVVVPAHVLDGNAGPRFAQ